MNKTKIMHVDFQARKNPAADRWFPEESLMRLAEILLESDLEGAEEKGERPEE